jgi:hypothetical protein
VEQFKNNFFRSCLFLLLPAFSFAQLTDNFSDGDFTNNPAWTGNDTSFDISTNILHSTGPQASSVIYLSTPNTLIDSAEWNFLVRLDFNPSSTNQVKIYLVSDQVDLSGSLNGYFVQFGESGTAPDSLDIFLQNGTTATKVFTGVSGIMTSSSSNSVRVKIIRHVGGTWNVFADKTGGSNFNSEGSFTDNSIATTSWFGVVCKYSTASRYNLYYFDDFSISNIVADTTKPTIVSVNVLSDTAIDVKFSEPVDINSAQTLTNYSVNNFIGNPTSANVDGSDLGLVHLRFATAFANATSYILSISGIKDLSNNVGVPGSYPFSFYHAGLHDVLINEIMADPDPAVGLPAVEFVELYNRTQFPVSLNGWTFSDASTTVTIPNVTILADSFIVLCAAGNIDSFSSSIARTGLSSLPSLNNTGDSLSLKDNLGNLIHRVYYSDSWYNDNSKKNGGWTLELIDANNACGESTNWKASIDPNGGTPGRRNSVAGPNPDTIPPQLFRAVLLDSNSVILYWSEPMDFANLQIASHYLVNNGIGLPLAATSASADNTSVQLDFTSNFTSGIIYTVTVSNLSDCTGNSLGMNSSARFSIAEFPEPNDVVINEILFNPKTGGYDFVELYNRSNKVIDLRQLDILEKDISDPSSVLEQASVSSQSYLLFPGYYVLLSENIENIRQNYFVEYPNALLEVPSLPNFPDDDGICVLRLHNSIVIDSLSFSNKWHFALLDIEDGVSLERIDYDKPTQDKSNWHSAASTVGFGTPTYQNSQFSETGISDDEIQVDPEVFTPDNDGEKDYTTIDYQFSEPGYVMNVKVFDIKGREVRNLVKNELLSSKGLFQWDGTDDDNQKARVGIYLICIEVFNLQGKVKRFKRQVVLGAKLK